jgi:putative exporter of polyketide antibiotics
MAQWLTIIGLSALVGFLCAHKLHGAWGGVAAGAIPWFGLLGWLLYNEYFVPYQGGGASMWPVAQLFAGTVAAIVGVASYALAQRLRTGRVRTDT